MNRLFHYKERNGSPGKEVLGGILVGILSVCGMFMNMQVLAGLQVTGPYNTTGVGEAAANGEIYAGIYFLSMLVAFAGSLAMGMITGLPLVQVSSLGLGTVLIALAGSGNGLTWYNLLAISFLASVLSTILLAVPGLLEKVLNSIPLPVRKGIPGAVGILLAWVSLQLTGVVSVNGSALPVYGTGAVLLEASDSVKLSQFTGFGNFSYQTDKFHPLMLLSAAAVILAVIAFLVLRARSGHPYFYSLLIGTVFFLFTNLCFVCVNWKNFGLSLDSMWGRLWTVGSEDALHHHFYSIFSGLSFGEIFKKGFDFSAYTENGGNVVLLLLTGVLTVFLTNLLHAGTVCSLAEEEIGVEKKSCHKVMLCNAICGILAPLIGAVPPSVGEESLAGTREGTKSGLASVAAAGVYLLSMFVWVIPFIFVTLFSYDIKFTMYGHYGETLQALTESSFAVADIIMAMVGISMVKRSMDIQWKDTLEALPFLGTLLAAFALSSLVYGAAAGILIYIITALTDGKQKITTGQWLCAAFSVLLLCLAVL